MVFNLSALDALAPNLWIFIAHIIAFTVVVIVLIWFAWKPTSKFMKKRKELINKELTDANNDKNKAKLLVKSANQKVTESTNQAMKIQELSEEQAHLHWETMIKKTKSDATLVMEKAQNDINKLEIEFEENMSEEIARVALIAAEELMKKNMDSKENKKIIDSIIKSIENNE